MNRRQFISAAATGGAIVVCGGGLWARMVYARHQFSKRLIRGAQPILTKKAHGELQTLPVAAREEIRTWFHGPCLNSAEFVRYICSNSFAEKLSSCQSDQEREWCVLNAFVGRVVSEAEILNRVQVIAEEVGSDLDRNWATSCDKISDKWDAHIKKSGPSIADDLTQWVEPIIKSEITAAIQQAQSTTHRPAISKTVASLGESALMLLPLARYGATGALISVPMFFFLAFHPVYQFVVARLNNPIGEYQRAISSRIALLGNRLGAEFETEVKTRITALHNWQEAALTEAANELAWETIGIS